MKAKKKKQPPPPKKTNKGKYSVYFIGKNTKPQLLHLLHCLPFQDDFHTRTCICRKIWKDERKQGETKLLKADI